MASVSQPRSRFLFWRGRSGSRSHRANSVQQPGFFDSYSSFYETSETGATPGRLNARHQALIAANLPIISGKTILDLASHDGRWSFAALKAGARHVTGIEARPELVRSAESNLKRYGISAEQYCFISGDAIERLDSLRPGSIETVFCFGFLYHTPHHVLLLSKIARLHPHHLIIDTAVQPSGSHSYIVLYMEKVAVQASAALPVSAHPGHALVGTPSRAALEMMLTSFGWKFSYYDWHNADISDWRDLPDYRDDRRVTVVATLS